MFRNLPGWTFFISAYFLLALGFLAIHFLWMEDFSAVVQTITVQGRSSVGTSLSPPRIRHISLTTNGLELRLKPLERAFIVTNDGIRHSLAIRDWNVEENSVNIALSNGAGFRLEFNPEGSTLQIIPTIPATQPPVQSFELPLHPMNGTLVTKNSGNTQTFAIQTAKSNYIATLPTQSTWDPLSGRITMVVSNAHDPILTIIPSQQNKKISALTWFEEVGLLSQEKYTDQVEKWMRLVRNGWNTRLNSVLTSPQIPQNENLWNDTMVAALLADAITNGEFSTRLQETLNANARNPLNPDWLSSPYLGNIVNAISTYMSDLKQKTNSVLNYSSINALQNTQPNILTAYLSTSAQVKELLSDASAPPNTNISNEELIARIRILQRATELNMEPVSTLRNARTLLIEKYLLPRVVYWEEDGLWLFEDDNSVRLDLSAIAGHLLTREAEQTQSDRLFAIGQQMKMSVLSSSDETGRIPRKLLFEMGMREETGFILPEQLYTIMVKPAAYPRYISLSKELGSGSWAMTGAEEFFVQSSPQETLISMDFPIGSSHHMAIEGIQEFDALYINERKWSSDPNFQSYHSGWVYDAPLKTLYLKVRHRIRTETIRILHDRPEVEDNVPVAEDPEA